MLPKKKRVTKEDFHTILKGGKSLSTQLFLFHYKRNGLPQYSFVAPKKPFKNAVLRNKWRRMGYNIIRNLPLESGSGIFIYKKQAILASQEQIKNDIISILNKTSLLK